MKTGIFLQVVLAVIGLLLLIASAAYLATDTLLGWIGVVGGALIVIGALIAIIRHLRAAKV